MVEYGLVLGLLGLVGFPLVQRMGEEVEDLFDNTADAVSYASLTFDDSLDPDAFVFEVNTATGAIFPSAGGTIEIDWGDETANSTCTTTYIIDPNNPLICSYPEAGTYLISITGDMTGYGQLYSDAYKPDITRMIQWGNTGLTDLSDAFYGATNLTDVPPTLPEGVSSINRIFAHASSINDADISLWDTTNITTMSGSFRSASSFNQDIDEWNMSNVENIVEMFFNASSFNQNLSSWDTSQVGYMRRTFRGTPFNGDIRNWDVSKVYTMQAMFRDAKSFNQDISSWDVSKVNNFYYTFYGADSFNQDLSGWDTSNSTLMEGMFAYADSFESDLSNWDVSKVSNFTFMFGGALAFDSDLSNWDVTAADTLGRMFEDAASFTGDVSPWDVSAVSNMHYMFKGTGSFYGDLSGWCVPLIASRPIEFSDGSSLVSEPAWGSCP